jgi:hypothetical protein
MSDVTAVNAVVPVFKALADESRLKLLGVLAQREASVDQLAVLLELRAPTVSHHLAKLKAIGLVDSRAEGNVHVYWLDGDALRRICRETLSPERVTSFAPEDEAAWEEKVLRDFVVGEKLKEIPVSKKKRHVVLAWLASYFTPGERYTEKQVNTILGRHHPDTATLRRELISEEAELMTRKDGIYWLR